MLSREEIIQTFDPSGVGVNNCNLFGLPFNLAIANIIVLGIPWEVTVSYHSGTAKGPDSILQASPQLDLYDFDNPEGWKQGIFMPHIPDFIQAKNNELRPKALNVIACIEQGDQIENHPDLASQLEQINAECLALNQWVFNQTSEILQQGKRVGVIGGDHSVPLGYIQALATHYPNFGILQIDAHADLRLAYQGFEFSHASIMRNVLQTPQV
ncbi:MAG: arginase family protein, partial [Pseudanabaenales cyanobacterium]|nr:arginase family protein [Pseudanabaenales cyanobacterium]